MSACVPRECMPPRRTASLPGEPLSGSSTCWEGKLSIVNLIRIRLQWHVGRCMALIGWIGVLACAAQVVPPPPPPPPPPAPPPACLGTDPLPAAAVSIALDPTVKFQTIAGFGTTVRLFDDPHVTNTFDPATSRAAVIIPPDQQAAILKALYTDLGLTRDRYATDVNIEPVNDNSDPLVTDLSKFNFAWKGGDGHSALAQQAYPFGLATVWGSPIGTESWMSHDDPAEFAEWSFAIIQRWNQIGNPLPYWSIKNEPALSKPTIRGAFLRDAVKLLGPRLAAAGINTKLVPPDETSPASALASASIILADPVARRYVAAIPFHLYGAVPSSQPNTASLAELAALARQYGLPLWMSEWYTPDWFTWAKTMQSMLADYDVAAVDYLFGYFGQWQSNGGELIIITSTGNLYTGFVRTKQYWTMWQWSHFIRPGAVRIRATSSDPQVKVTAFLNGDSVVVVAVNTATADRSVQVGLGAGSPCVKTVTSERTSTLESAHILDPFTLTGPGFTSALPATSVTTFVLK
jgi:O-glycosyl hydrolase